MTEQDPHAIEPDDENPPPKPPVDEDLPEDGAQFTDDELDEMVSEDVDEPLQPEVAADDPTVDDAEQEQDHTGQPERDVVEQESEGGE